MMSQCVVPNRNRRKQGQEQVEGEEGNGSSHVHNQPESSTHVVPMSNYGVAELTWENGQLAVHGLRGLLPVSSTKPIWSGTGDTLESLVHQATIHKHHQNTAQNIVQPSHIPAKTDNMVTPSRMKWAHDQSSGGQTQTCPGSTRKRTQTESNQCKRNLNRGLELDECADCSACASASATFCRENDTTLMTWGGSFESSPCSMKIKTTDEDSASHGGSENRNEEQETRCESGRSHSTRRYRAAATHNQSERRRRDRINQKMKTLQKLVPNASKTDKASMLDEVIEYLKQLQAQVRMMSVRSMPPMMMPLGMQHHLHMSLLARMGMGLGMPMGMLDMSAVAPCTPPQSLPPLIHPAVPVASAAPAFVPSPFVAPPMMPAAQANADSGAGASVPLLDPYYTMLAQSMNVDLYNKTAAAIYRQQVNQMAQRTSVPSQSNNNVQGE